MLCRPYAFLFLMSLTWNLHLPFVMWNKVNVYRKHLLLSTWNTETQERKIPEKARKRNRFQAKIKNAAVFNARSRNTNSKQLSGSDHQDGVDAVKSIRRTFVNKLISLVSVSQSPSYTALAIRLTSVVIFSYRTYPVVFKSLGKGAILNKV